MLIQRFFSVYMCMGGGIVVWLWIFSGDGLVFGVDLFLDILLAGVVQQVIGLMGLLDHWL